MNKDVRAEVLSQALPYIQKYNRKIVVIKIGGSSMDKPELLESLMHDVVLLSLVGVKPILVHGGGRILDDYLQKMGLEKKAADGKRYIDDETMELTQMVLAGKVNKDIVATLHKNGGKAIGISGIDDGVLHAVKQNGVCDHGYAGEVQTVNAKAIFDVMENGYVPVIAAVGADDEGRAYHIKADSAAAAVAAAVKAESIVVMTDARGILAEQDNDDSLISVLKISEAPRILRSGKLPIKIVPKLEGCVKAVREGVKKAAIVDSREAHSILIELMTDSGSGTLIKGAID